MIKIHKLFFLFVLTLVCCRKPYNPPAVSSPNSYLVVEGVINSGSDSTIIKLSKTVKLNNKSSINAVLGAIVTVESDQNNSWPLIALDNKGNYGAPALGLSPLQKYRLKISIGGQQYASDLVTVKPTPPIDTLGYLVNGGKVKIYINAHDPANSTRYYRWAYDETWIFHSAYESTVMVDTIKNAIVTRPDDQSIYFCYGNHSSSSVLINSTERLSSDVLLQNPIVDIPLTSEKFEEKYSILVRQYALSKDAYQFYQNLQKNTEQLGSIFDAQPSQLMGNIHNVNNANEPVIGYITATNVQSKRIFIPVKALPSGILPDDPYSCTLDTAFFKGAGGQDDAFNILVRPPRNYIPTSPKFNGNAVVGYNYTTPICADCTLRGTKTKPSFWQ